MNARFEAADLARFAEMQQQMLTRAAEVVAPGGRLIYTTCSSEADENDAVVEVVLRNATAAAAT